MRWQEFVNKCEEVEPGSGEKLERIKENREAYFDKNAPKKDSAFCVLTGLFLWVLTKEGYSYWENLSQKLPNQK